MKSRPANPTLKQKVEMYEKVLHGIQICSEVSMRGDLVRKYLRNICDWSYSHRCGNGRYTDSEQRDTINEAFWNLNNLES